MLTVRRIDQRQTDGFRGSASPFHLSFGGHAHNLNAGQEDPSTAKRFESQHGASASLDRAMVLFDKIVEIFGLADLDGRFTIIIDGFECSEIGAAFADGHRLGHAIVGDRFLRVTLPGCSLVPMGAQ